MQNINQIFYLMFAVFAMGIALNAYADFRNQKIRSNVKVYWIVAMTLIVISSLSYAVGSFGMPLFLFLGSTFLAFSLLAAGYLFRSISRSLTRQWIVGSIGLVWYVYRPLRLSTYHSSPLFVSPIDRIEPMLLTTDCVANLRDYSSKKGRLVNPLTLHSVSAFRLDRTHRISNFDRNRS
jgi:cytochrome c oxidase subunit IV